MIIYWIKWTTFSAMTAHLLPDLKILYLCSIHGTEIRPSDVTTYYAPCTPVTRHLAWTRRKYSAVGGWPPRSRWWLYLPPRLVLQISFVYDINWLIFIAETECLLRGINWIFIRNSGYFYSLCVLLALGKQEPLFPQTIRTSLHTASGVFQLFCTAEEQLLRSWRLQFQIQVRAHKRLLAIQSRCLTSRLTINLDSLAMLPTLLLKFCRPQEGICKYYMFRHVDKHLLQQGSDICDNGSTSIIE